MKNLLLLLLLAMSGLMIMSCEGPPGNDGLDGTNGIDGVDGVDGMDGADGTAFCLTCHNLTHRNELNAQYQMTRHFNATAVGYAGGRNGCAKCHSHEGFVETVFTGMDTTAANIPIPTGIGCTTCHSTHETFDFENDGADYALRTIAPVDLLISDDDLDFGGTSNLCAYCHQPRRAAPVADDNGNFNITSSHYGPHHAPNATFVYGIGGYEVAGPETYPAPGENSHTSGSSCVECHMGALEDGKGAHTLIPTESACTKCHSNGAPSNAEIVTLLEELGTMLKAEGVLDDEGHVVTGEFPVDVAGAFYNYALIEEDLSHGIHNPTYAKALLKNSIASLQ